VYKGIQAGTGAMLAVKRAQEGSKQGAPEFKKEIEVLSRVHHNNLVGLVGFCFEKSEQMLVYEYMPNGTLTDWLRGEYETDNKGLLSLKPNLSWFLEIMRRKVSVQVVHIGRKSIIWDQLLVTLTGSLLCQR